MCNSRYENYTKIIDFLEEYALIELSDDNFYDEVGKLVFSKKYEECEYDLITITRIIEDKYIHSLLEDIDEEIFKFINLLSDLERLNIYSKQDLLNAIEHNFGDDEDESILLKNTLNNLEGKLSWEI